MTASGSSPPRRGLELPLSIVATVPIVVVHVRTDRHDPVDPPTVIGGWALIRAARVLQSPLREVPEASSHAQGVLIVLADALHRLPHTNAVVRIVIPDGAAADMLTGRVEVNTKKMFQLVARPRTLIAEKLPNAKIEVGRFYEIIGHGTFDDVWA